MKAFSSWLVCHPPASRQDHLGYWFDLQGVSSVYWKMVDLNLAWRTLADLPLLPGTVEVLVQARARKEREMDGIGKGMESV